MPQALQTDVTTLSLTYGKRERHTPSARVIEPASGIAPAAGRGNLYILIEVEGEEQGKARLYRELLNTIQESYYYHKGAIADALTASVRAAHSYIQQYNQYHSSKFNAGVTCLVATSNEIISAQAGPTILAVRSNAGLQWFSPLNDESFASLGDSVMPSVEIGRVAGHAGIVVIAMNSAWANYLEVPLMQEAMSVPRARAVADQLAGIGIDAPEELTILVITFLEESAERIATAPAPATALTIERATAMPTTAIPQAKPSRWQNETEEQAWGTGDLDDQVEQEEVPKRERSSPLASISASVAGFGKRLQRPKRQKTASAPAKPKKPRGPARRIPFVLGIILVLLIAIAAATFGMWYIQGQERTEQFNAYMQGARVQLDAALATSDENQARLYLQAGEEQLRDAELYASEHPDIIKMRNEIAEISARINHVVQLLSGFDVPLIAFPEGDRQPDSVFVDGLNVYIQDNGRGTLERYKLDETTADRLAGDGSPQLLLQTGTTVGGRQVGELAEAVWAPAAGNRTASGPLVLDRSNQLFAVTEGLGPTNVAMAENNDLGFVSGMYFYAGNLYLLDTASSQLWRYRPSGESYTFEPEPYFPTEISVNLSTVVDAAIDGNVWLLHPNGTILQYFSGAQELFTLDFADPPFSEAVSIWANEAETTGGHLYVADAASNRILIFNKEGRLLKQLMPGDHPGILNNLRDIYVDEISNYLYALTDQALYQVPIPPLDTEAITDE